MKFLQTAVEKIITIFGGDKFNSYWNQKKYEKFYNLLTPNDDLTFGQFFIKVYSNKFDVWFKNVKLLESIPNISPFGVDRTYHWIWSDGPFQQDFIDFIDEYITRKITENELADKAAQSAAFATLMSYVPGKVIF